MKYIKYTYVDVKTKKPVSEQPARRGPVHPTGITPTFALEDSFKTGVPSFYGIAEDTYEPEDWMKELTEDEFYSVFKQELKKRSSKKRKQVEQGGLTISETLSVRTDIDSQNRISSLVASINNNPSLTTIDFEASPGTWVELTSQEALDIGIAVSNHVQGCFTSCKGIHAKIDEMTTLDDALAIVTKINQFTGQGT